MKPEHVTLKAGITLYNPAKNIEDTKQSIHQHLSQVEILNSQKEKQPIHIKWDFKVIDPALHMIDPEKYDVLVAGEVDIATKMLWEKLQDKHYFPTDHLEKTKHKRKQGLLIAWMRTEKADLEEVMKNSQMPHRLEIDKKKIYVAFANKEKMQSAPDFIQTLAQLIKNKLEGQPGSSSSSAQNSDEEEQTSKNTSSTTSERAPLKEPENESVASGKLPEDAETAQEAEKQAEAARQEQLKKEEAEKQAEAARQEQLKKEEAEKQAEAARQEQLKKEEAEKQADAARQEQLKKEEAEKQADAARQEQLKKEEAEKQAEAARQEQLKKEEAEKQAEAARQEQLKKEEAEKQANLTGNQPSQGQQQQLPGADQLPPTDDKGVEDVERKEKAAKEAEARAKKLENELNQDVQVQKQQVNGANQSSFIEKIGAFAANHPRALAGLGVAAVAGVVASYLSANPDERFTQLATLYKNAVSEAEQNEIKAEIEELVNSFFGSHLQANATELLSPGLFQRIFG